MTADLASGVSQQEHRELRCRRLLFRCWHRGTQEGDLILRRFAETYLARLDTTQIERFEVLLDCTDPDLFDWIVAGSNNAGVTAVMERPLSPFMFPTWYCFQITSLLSIIHRFTGIGLAIGSILLAWWLVAVAVGGELYAATHAFIASPIGMVLLFLWSAAFFYHLCALGRGLIFGVRRAWGVFAASGQARTFDFRAGDVGFVPFAMGHYVENTRATPMRFLEIFKSNCFADAKAEKERV
jgi:succinate dehydrogenase cytochrome b556 subunit